jgi:hypothetical protein
MIDRPSRHVVRLRLRSSGLLAARCSGSAVRACVGACACVALVMMAAASGSAQGSLATARQLYGSAMYDEAFTMLTRLLAGSGPLSQDRPVLEFYRVLCLVGLGDATRAEWAIDAMTVSHPRYRPSEADVPPRLRLTFTNARARLLPKVIAQEYAAAKAAFDRQDHATAEDGFTQVLQALSDPDVALAVERPPLSDIRLMATGFLDALALLEQQRAQPAEPEAPLPELPERPERPEPQTR